MRSRTIMTIASISDSNLNPQQKVMMILAWKSAGIDSSIPYIEVGGERSIEFFDNETVLVSTAKIQLLFLMTSMKGQLSLKDTNLTLEKTVKYRSKLGSDCVEEEFKRSPN